MRTNPTRAPAAARCRLLPGAGLAERVMKTVVAVVALAAAVACSADLYAAARELAPAGTAQIGPVASQDVTELTEEEDLDEDEELQSTGFAADAMESNR